MPAINLAKFEYGNDVWMVQVGSRSSFQPETVEHLGLRQFAGRNEFEGDRAIKAHLASFVNPAHPPTRNQSQDFVIPEAWR